MTRDSTRRAVVVVVVAVVEKCESASVVSGATAFVDRAQGFERSMYADARAYATPRDAQYAIAAPGVRGGQDMRRALPREKRG